jgi:hemin uptake protein HemP
MAEPPSRKEPDPSPVRAVPPRPVRAEELFQGAREIYIDHAGTRYRLRITRRNKLILQK